MAMMIAILGILVPAVCGGTPQSAANQVTAQEEREVMDFLLPLAPNITAELTTLKASDPAAYTQRIRNLLDKKHRLDELKRNDPAGYESRIEEIRLEQRSLYLSQQYRATKDPAAQARVKQELTTVLDHLFDIRGRNREAEIRALEAEIGRLKEALAARQHNREAILKGKLEEMLGESPVREW
ncbi:MAG: hypothetical protein AB1714_26975 [Acidobacteriota bacterium]